MICSHHGCALIRQGELRQVYRRTGLVRDLLPALFATDFTAECRNYQCDENGELSLFDSDVNINTERSAWNESAIDPR